MNQFRGFKKIKSTKNETHFEHANGSKLVVPHKALDKGTLDALKALPVKEACGGDIRKYSGEDAEPEDQEVTPDTGAPSVVQNFGPTSKQEEFTPPAPDTPAQPAPQNFNLSAQGQAPSTNQVLAEKMNAMDPYKGLNTQIAGHQEEANAVGNFEAQKAQDYKKMSDDMATVQYQSQQNAWNHKIETDNMISDMKNSHIDPKAYLNNMSSGQKVSTAIGLILGGMSGGILGNGKNPALEFLNQQISRDVEAQKANQDNKSTIFNALQKQFGNDMDATKMTQAFYTAKLANDIAGAAAKAGTPLAEARAKQVIGPLQDQLAQLHLQVGMRQAAMTGLKSGASAAAVIPFMVPKDQQQKALDSYGKIEELNQLESNMNQSADHLSSQMMNGAMSPHDTDSAKQAFVGAVQKMSEGRYNQDAANKLVTSLLPQNLDTAGTIRNKEMRRKEFFDAFRKEHAAVLQSHFIPIPQPAPRFKKR